VPPRPQFEDDRFAGVLAAARGEVRTTDQPHHVSTPLSATVVRRGDRPCFIVRDANGQALAFVYCEDDPGRRATGKLLTRDEARRIAASITMRQ
jgi:hypothetical protein